MKKIYTLILLTSFAAVTLQAQNNTTTKKKLAWGIKTGLNVSNLRIKNGDAADWKTGLVTGVFLTFKTGSPWSIQPEFLYSSMGAKGVMNNQGMFTSNMENTSLRL